MIDNLKKDAETRMRKAVDVLKNELTKLRTGRANAGLLDAVRVDYYGNEVPLSQVANIAVADARTITVTPWEKNMVQAIEKAILTSDLGLNPSTSGNVIRVPLPPLTEERRKDLTKVVRHEGENAKVAIRNVRRDANNDLKTALKDKTIAEDVERKTQDQIQKLTDKYIAEVDDLVKKKEKEVMEI